MNYGSKNIVAAKHSANAASVGVNRICHQVLKSPTSCAESDKTFQEKEEIMTITIDGQVIELLDDDNNIVDVADRAKIGIPALCYRTKKSKGCCHSCVVEIDGKNEYACGTKPQAGMTVIVKRDDLDELRKERIKKYKEGIQTSENQCCCGGTDRKTDCCWTWSIQLTFIIPMVIGK